MRHREKISIIKKAIKIIQQQRGKREFERRGICYAVHQASGSKGIIDCEGLFNLPPGGYKSRYYSGAFNWPLNDKGDAQRITYLNRQLKKLQQP